jgi:hypothetical protein
MKSIIQDSLKQLLANRYLMTLSIATIVLAIGAALYIGLSIQPSELQVVVHYSAFGIRHLYLDHWYYLLTFVVFVLLVAVLNVIITTKIFMIKGGQFASLFAWLTLIVIVFGTAMAISVINYR